MKIKYIFAIGLLSVASLRADEVAPTVVSDDVPVQNTIDCSDLLREKADIYVTLLRAYKSGDDKTQVSEAFVALMKAYQACHDEKLAKTVSNDVSVDDKLTAEALPNDCEGKLNVSVTDVTQVVA